MREVIRARLRPDVTLARKGRATERTFPGLIAEECNGNGNANMLMWRRERKKITFANVEV